MRLHILGICGTFMAGIALLAREAKHEVSGSDQHFHPPMGELLRDAGVALHEGYSEGALRPAPDLVVIGNALSRGNPAVEYALAQGIPYNSGAEYLAREHLAGRWVIAVAGTHGKTSTTAMLSQMLERAGLSPGFLIGGLPLSFGVSARLGQGPFFVIEADEYDTAFFDKRPKFIHYRPLSLVLNNLEYDHADIYQDLAAIEQQFHYFLRTVPATGHIFMPTDDEALERVMEQGCWSERHYFAPPGNSVGRAQWRADGLTPDYSRLLLTPPAALGAPVELSWPLCGRYNAHNALAAAAAAAGVGVSLDDIVDTLGELKGVRRRMERIGEAAGVTVYDDFAHHPTAIRGATEALSSRMAGSGRLLAAIDPASASMRRGVHREQLATALHAADHVWWHQPPALGWSPAGDMAARQTSVCGDVAQIVDGICAVARPGDVVLMMSSGAFGSLGPRLLQALANNAGRAA